MQFTCSPTCASVEKNVQGEREKERDHPMSKLYVNQIKDLFVSRSARITTTVPITKLLLLLWPAQVTTNKGQWCKEKNGQLVIELTRGWGGTFYSLSLSLSLAQSWFKVKWVQDKASIYPSSILHTLFLFFFIFIFHFKVEKANLTIASFSIIPRASFYWTLTVAFSFFFFFFFFFHSLWLVSPQHPSSFLHPIKFNCSCLQ